MGVADISSDLPRRTTRVLAEFDPAGDGATLDTVALQAGLDAVADAGGGTLVVGAGTYLSGGLLLRSATTLHLEAGATLLASPRYSDFTAHEAFTTAEGSRHALLYARGAHDVAVTGPGRILGNAQAYFSAERDASGYRRPADQRPRMLVLERCEGVRIADLVVEQAPMWTLHLVSCRDVEVSGVVVDNDLGLSNTDALNLDGCQRVRVRDCRLSAGDDGICVKTSRRPEPWRMPARDIVISGCVLRSTSCALKIGTETFDDIEDVRITDCVIEASNRGVGVFSRDGGAIRRVAVSGIHLDCRMAPPAFWGAGDPVFVSWRHRDPLVLPGPVQDLRFSAITGSAEGAITLHSEEVGRVRGVVLEDIALEQVVSTSPRQGVYDLRPPVNPERPTGTGLDNAHWIDAKGRSWGVDPYPGGLPAVYAERVDDLVVSGLHVRRPVPLPAGWSAQEVVQR